LLKEVARRASKLEKGRGSTDLSVPKPKGNGSACAIPHLLGEKVWAGIIEGSSVDANYEIVPRLDSQFEVCIAQDLKSVVACSTVLARRRIAIEPGDETV
jgi:hypothetical protein